MREDINDPRVNPRLAADLSRAPEQQAVDLSKAAVKGRDRTRRLERAAKWARTMNRTFKGITGSHNRRGYVRVALMSDPVLRKEIDDASE
jgi:hypothetical protein